MPLAADEQVWTCKLTPGLPKVANMSLHLLQPLEGVRAVVECLEISTLCGSTKQQGVRGDVLDAVFTALDSGVDRPFVGKVGS
jgi:hypothetical protein